jgi:hypothetical protein
MKTFLLLSILSISSTFFLCPFATATPKARTIIPGVIGTPPSLEETNGWVAGINFLIEQLERTGFEEREIVAANNLRTEMKRLGYVMTQPDVLAAVKKIKAEQLAILQELRKSLQRGDFGPGLSATQGQMRVQIDALSRNSGILQILTGLTKKPEMMTHSEIPTGLVKQQPAGTTRSYKLGVLKIFAVLGIGAAATQATAATASSQGNTGTQSPNTAQLEFSDRSDAPAAPAR